MYLVNHCSILGITWQLTVEKSVGHRSSQYASREAKYSARLLCSIPL
jgi:hypothetical protein